MIIENQYGTVDLDWKNYKKIVLCFSGGADSTLLLWLSLNELAHKQETTIQVFTGVTPQKGLFKQFTSQENFDMMRMEFPHLKTRVPDRIVMYNITQEELGEASIDFQRRGTHDLTMFALTANPPYDIMKQHDLLRNRETIRDQEREKNLWSTAKDTSYIQYNPFRNVDKRWIAQCYKDFNLWRFYYNTISCERLRNTPDMRYSEEPCKHCWWCREKKMAFGMYDGGIK